MSEKIREVPKHVGLIMDGNRRWAEARGMDKVKGYNVGAERIKPIVVKAGELDIPYLTFWAFSTENWKRPEREVAALTSLFLRLLTDPDWDELAENGVRVRTIGDVSKFGSEIYSAVTDIEERTALNEKVVVNLALNYGGRDEIVRAGNKALANGYQLTEENIDAHLDTAGQPNPDLIIRTGDDKRLSGFMIWQSPYAELDFSKTLWPEFTPEEFEHAVNVYRNPTLTRRNFGG